MKTLVAILVLAAAAAQAQTAKPAAKAPEKVDKALRERVRLFYQSYVDGRFKDAEPLVAQDTKNIFFAAGKPQFLRFEISGISYSSNFTRASVLTLCKQQMLLPGGNGMMEADLPISSDWKLEKGKWYWWVDQTSGTDTPFGKIGPPIGSAGSTPLPKVNLLDPSIALHKVSADRQSLSLKIGGSAEVTFSNSAQGVMSVVVTGNPPGFDVKPARADMPAGSKATFTVKAAPDATSAILTFTVQPTGEIVEMKVAIN